MPVRDCRRLGSQLEQLAGSGQLAAVAAELVDVAIAAAVVNNALELIPRRRVVADSLARELELRLQALDERLSLGRAA